MSDSNDKIVFHQAAVGTSVSSSLKASIAALVDVLNKIKLLKEEIAAKEQAPKAVEKQSEKPVEKQQAEKTIEPEKKTAVNPEKSKTNAVKEAKPVHKSESKAAAEFKAKEKTVKGVVKKIEWPAPELAVYSDEALSAHERDFYIVRRRKNEMTDFSVMHTYLSYKKAYDPGKNGWDTILDYETGAKIGDIPHIKLSAVWEIAQRYSGADRSAEEDARFGITLAEWEAAFEKIEAYIQQSDIEVFGADKNDGILLQHLFKMSTLEYQLLSINKADKVFEVVRAAVLCDIEEIARAAKQWKKIKNYKHKVALDYAHGGIFSDEDAYKIQAGTGIDCLNDLCMYDVYALKALLLEHAFGDLVKDINGAFREDRRRRKDRIWQKYPYIFGNIILVLLTVLAYNYKYTIIKSPQAALEVNIGVAAFLVTVLSVLFACARAVFRRKSNPQYIYRTKKIKKRIRFMSAFGLFVLCSIVCFHQRYDGYNDRYYYRDVGENEIAIAGQVQQYQNYAVIPESIDGKTVVEIDLYAFDKSGITELRLPGTVKKIETAAFKDCTNLESVVYEGDIEADSCSIGKKAFAGCTALSDFAPMGMATSIAEGAFKDCQSLQHLDLSSATFIGERAFESCPYIYSIVLGENLESLPNRLFKNCTALVNVSGFEYVKHIGKETFYGCDSLLFVDFSQIKTIGKRSFYGCDSITNIYIPNTIEEVGADAFSECNSVSDLQVSFFGKNAKKSHRSSLAYYFSCSNHIGDLTVTITGMPVISSKNFKKCPAITNIVLADEVTTLEPRAFAGMNISSITLAPGITEISEKAFANCGNLEKVLGAESVTAVGKRAFENCFALASIQLPAALSIDDYAFMQCTSLAEFRTFAQLHTLGESAFEECSSLYELDLSSATLTAIGENVFKNCYNLVEAKLPASVATLSNGAFYGCSALLNLVHEGSLIEIGDLAFQYSGIRHIDLTSVKKIGESAFEACENLDNVTVPLTIESLGRRAFADCGSMKSFTSPFEVGRKNFNVASLLGNSGVETLVVTRISQANSNFISGADNLSRVVFDCELKTIKSKAFKDAENLYSIVLPDTITSIGTAAFKGCANLSEITLPSAITEIANEMFSGCRSLSNLEIPAGVQSIGRHAFYECESITDITVPASVSEISSYAFSECDFLFRVNFAGGVQEIEEGAFMDCDNLEDIVLPDSLVKIGENAFNNCYSLREMHIPASVTTVGEDALKGCYSLEILSIPSIVKTTSFLGRTSTTEKAVSYITDSTNLVEIRITAAEEIAKNAFKDLYNLETVVLSESVTKIGNGAFDGCYALQKVILPNENVYKKYADVFEGVPVYESFDSVESYAEKAERLEREEAEKKAAEEAAKKEAAKAEK